MIRGIFLIIISIFLISCNDIKLNYDERLKIDKELKNSLSTEYKKLKNDCLLIAVNIDSAIKAKKILKDSDIGFSKILAMVYEKPSDPKIYGHVVFLFTYPKNNLKYFYIFDENGTRIFRGNILFLSPNVIAKSFFPSGYKINKAYYLDN